MTVPSYLTELEAVLGHPVSSCAPLGRSWGLDVMKVEFVGGPSVAVKAGVPDVPGHLEIEAYMLRALAVQSDLPVPAVLHCTPALLALEWIDNEGGPASAAHERHAAELLAALHGLSAPHFGYDRNTVIGGLVQPNGQSESWVEFFTHKRLLYMARIAMTEGALQSAEMHRLETLAGRLSRYLNEPDKPSLLHGDLWQGNILVKGEAIAGFIDPAVYCGHREIELAFTTLFGTFGEPFFDAYSALAPLDAEFFDLRKDIYNLYPNLVHAALFGRSYVPAILRVLDRLGV